ncbi:type I-B CRISPR-associated protein Cas7/Csh2 [Caldicellulosiruptoraceae bacterium PP1]
MSNEVINNRSEILFIYDCKDSNPNGDPFDENKPRVDEETGQNIVTDVRLKRTCRDYWSDYKGLPVFIAETRNTDGKLRTRDERLEDFSNEPEKVKECIDVKLFGATIAVKDKTLVLTGPVQFKFGRSLHKVEAKYIKGTTVMPSKEGNEQGTFTEQYILPYSCIAFYGVINENAAKNQDINLTRTEIGYLFEALWNGTKNLLSRSKVGQMPRLLLEIVYNQGIYHLGDIDKRIKLISNKIDQEIRDVSDFKLDLTQLISVIIENKDKIKEINYAIDDRLSILNEGNEYNLNQLDKYVKVNLLKF